MGHVVSKNTSKIECLSLAGSQLACFSKNGNVDFYNIRTEEEAEAARSKKLRKLKRRLQYVIFCLIVINFD